MIFARTKRRIDSQCFVVRGGGGWLVETSEEGSIKRRNGRLVFHLRLHVKINYKLNDSFHFGQFNSINSFAFFFFHPFCPIHVHSNDNFVVQSFTIQSQLFGMHNIVFWNKRQNVFFSNKENWFRVKLHFYYCSNNCKFISSAKLDVTTDFSTYNLRLAIEVSAFN